MDSAKVKARIITAHGRHYTALAQDQKIWHCYARGKKKEVCVGDWVELRPQSTTEATIEQILPRRNLLYRSDQMRSKQFAANIDLLLFVVATEPSFSEDLLSRALIAAASAGIEVVIILNKCDLHDKLSAAQQKLAVYEQMGYQILQLSTHAPEALKQQLRPLLQHKTSLLLGQSAMGKSSILNILVPQAQAFTQAHSQALGTGKHTTTLSRLYALENDDGAIIDSPGFQAFGLLHLDDKAIVRGFPEFTPHLGHCRFYNCRHLKEPGCAITAAVHAGEITPARYDIYVRLLNELDDAKKY
ncbi:ribosome small subunit-dependent GTPase A [Brackiella oedipodis]|uniref:ribosome small subunit-dependent GTPase A n=1 Tax=Brackiella oedipodis TaxID=124225 RepID=UPI00048A6EBF|nr:ribosome small subunit-dependent GTPase A [Brackiella oedipodis]